MPRADDLSSLFGEPERGLRLRKGVIITWNIQTGENTVDVDGVPLANLPMLNITEALTITAGTNVGIISDGQQMWILGRLTQPGSEQFFTGSMPAISAPYYPVNSDAATQTSTVDSNYYPKWVGAWVINHRRFVFGARYNRSAPTTPPSGNYRVRWYTSYPSNIANPPGGTDMVVSALDPTPSVELGPFTYTWPAGMRKQVVYISYEARMTTGTTGVTWVTVLPTLSYGID